MKKFLFLLVFLPSCEGINCWDCELTTGHRTLPFPWQYTSTKQVYCNKTKKEIYQIIQDHEHTKGMSSYSHMTCTKRKLFR